MTRAEFSKATKLAAFKRCAGRCEKCTQKILGTPEYDHVIEETLTHDNSLENCMVLCARCHRLKSSKNRPEIDKTRRIAEKRAGVRKRQGFRGWRKFDGTPVYPRQSRD